MTTPSGVYRVEPPAATSGPLTQHYPGTFQERLPQGSKTPIPTFGSSKQPNPWPWDNVETQDEMEPVKQDMADLETRPSSCEG